MIRYAIIKNREQKEWLKNSDFLVNLVKLDFQFVNYIVSGKIPMNQVSKMSRVTQGVRLINLKENQKVTTIATTKDENDEENTEETVE